MQKVRRHTGLIRKVVFRLLIELLIHDLFHHSSFLIINFYFNNRRDLKEKN
jgi:hypothetical protein